MCISWTHVTVDTFLFLDDTRRETKAGVKKTDPQSNLEVVFSPRNGLMDAQSCKILRLQDYAAARPIF
jgi:hypothetical protein